MKYLYNILATFLILSLLLASCMDEEIGNCPTCDEEWVDMTFTLRIPQTEEVAMTRAVTSENVVEELTLLVFGSQEDNATLEDWQQVNQFTSTTNGYKFTVTLKNSGAAQKYLYMVANANDILTQNVLSATQTLGEIRALTSNVVTGETYLVMSGTKQTPIPSLDLVTNDFILTRNSAKVTVEMNQGIAYNLSQFQLRNGNESGQILSGAEVTEANVPAGDATLTQTDHTKPLYAYPSSNASKPFLVVSCWNAGKTYWYRIDLKKDESTYYSLLPNHHYQVTITAVNGPGYDSADEAAKHESPGNIEATIYDHQPTIYNMVTDGSKELGVSDTITIGADANATAEFFIKYFPGAATDLTVTVDNAATAWLEMDETDGYPKQETLNNTTGAYTETGTLYTYRAKTKIQNLSGGVRYGLIHVSAGGLSRDIVVKQEEEFLNDQFGTISLIMKQYERGSNWEITNTTKKGPYTNYWAFIRGTDTNNTVYGIGKEANGGKVRTEGFHFPMSDLQQFVYTFTLPNEAQYNNVSWRVELADGYKDKLLFWEGDQSTAGSGVTIDTNPTFLRGTSLSGQSFTFTNSLLNIQYGDGSIREDAYNYGNDAFKIVLTNNSTGGVTTLSYDLYHTGIFDYDDGSSKGNLANNTDAGWYYYEVILMGTNYWLDRNLGAKSSAFAIRDESGNFVTDVNEWPYRNDAAGGIYCIANAPSNNTAQIKDDICPTGFRIPYMSEFNYMVSDGNFSMAYESGGGYNYWCSEYQSEHGTVYFPKNRWMSAGSWAGDGNAGYYWTRTEALGTSGTERGYWLQYMKFSGSSATTGRQRIWPSDGSSNPNGMSVRCVYNLRTVETTHEIKFYVKGYTHVYLYTSGDGGQTVSRALSTWPGVQINVSSSLDMYKTFSYESVTEYETLYVRFSVMDNSGNITETYPDTGGVEFNYDQDNQKFFKKNDTDWTDTAQ